MSPLRTEVKNLIHIPCRLAKYDGYPLMAQNCLYRQILRHFFGKSDADVTKLLNKYAATINKWVPVSTRGPFNFTISLPESHRLMDIE